MIAVDQSKECQRSAWKTHKAKCLLNQRNFPVAQMDTLKDLHNFTSKHRPTIAEAGIRARNSGNFDYSNSVST
jgi:hypothetical protein